MTTKFLGKFGEIVFILRNAFIYRGLRKFLGDCYTLSPKIIARDSAEVGKILAKREEAKAAAAAEAEYEDNYGTLRERIQNAQFIRETYSIVQLTVPDEEGKGCGAVGTVNSINPAVFFTYSVKPGTDNLVCCNIKNNHLFTITVYSDCVFLEGNGYSYYYQNNPVSEEEFREIEKYLREEVNKQMKNKKK